MDWTIFWTAFGAIGSTIGAFCTAAAVIVALWQTKVSYKKKVKITFTDNITIVSAIATKKHEYVGVTVANIGNREIVINNWGFDLHDGTRMLIVPDASPLGRALQVELPHRLAIEESITLYYEKDLFHGVVKESIEKQKLKPDKGITFYVTDSTGNKYTVKTDKKANFYIKFDSTIDTNTICT